MKFAFIRILIVFTIICSIAAVNSKITNEEILRLDTDTSTKRHLIPRINVKQKKARRK
jgi:hypothetical protein